MSDTTRRYPFDVRPLHLETLDSYTPRLLRANFDSEIHQKHLIRLARNSNPDTTTETLWADIVAAKSGRDINRLLPATAPAFHHADGVSCEFCTEGITERFMCTLCAGGATVQQHPHFTSNVCLRHRRWVGPSARHHGQINVGEELVRAEITFRKLLRNQRIDAPFYLALRRALAPVPPRPVAWSQRNIAAAADIRVYPALVTLAAITTSVGFTEKFFDPNRTFIEAHAHLATTIQTVLGDNQAEVTRLMWLYFRPTFLDIRESLEQQRPFSPSSPHGFPLRAAVVARFRAPMRPLEPFKRYLTPTGDNIITPQNYLAVLTHQATPTPVTAAKRSIATICRAGHRTNRIPQVLSKHAALGTDNCPICENREILVGFNDMGTTHPWLAREFHPTLNAPHTPQTVFGGSPTLFWWRCKKGHEFPATASNRTAAHSGCPVCLNRTIVPTINDLPTLFPHLAVQWHPTMNTEPLEGIAPGSNYNAWWTCPKEHLFQKRVGERTRGANCHHCKKGPDASNRTIACARPDLADEWDHTRNHCLTPDDVLIGSQESYWWLCPNNTHYSYSQRPARRNIGFGCPRCTGVLQRGVNDIATKFGDISTE